MVIKKNNSSKKKVKRNGKTEKMEKQVKKDLYKKLLVSFRELTNKIKLKLEPIEKQTKKIVSFISKHEKILTVIILFFTLMVNMNMNFNSNESNKKLLADNNKAILKLVSIEKIENMPTRMAYNIPLLDEKYVNEKPYHLLCFKLDVKNVGNGTMNNLMAYDMKNLELTYRLCGNISSIDVSSLFHSNMTNYIASYSEIKEVKDYSYCFLSKDEEEEFYISCLVNNDQEYFDVNVVFLYQDIYKNIKRNILAISGKNDSDTEVGFEYKFMPQNVIQNNSIIKLDNTKLKLLSMLNEQYNKIFGKN